MALVYYPDDRPGVMRRRHGRGFTYLAPDGTRIDCPVQRRRFRALAVPPAYRDVWISPLENGHLQATGRDARARKQYRYHEEWAARRAARKFDRLGALGPRLPALRRWIASRLTGEAGDKDTAVAAALALIDRASLRPGNPEYASDNGSHGATTLEGGHAIFSEGSVHLDFPGKGGKRIAVSLHGRALQRTLQQSDDLPGAELITWLDDADTPRAVRSEHLNAVLADICGEGVTPKTLRTWNGSLAAFRVASDPDAVTVTAMCEAAAAELHNTPAVARSSYIHPSVLELAHLPDDARRNRLAGLRPAMLDGLRSGEDRLIALLENAAATGG